MEAITIWQENPRSEAGHSIQRDYLADVVGRYHGRVLTTAELEAAVNAFAADALAAPHGVLWIALEDDHAVGCVGLLLREDRTGIVTRLFVPDATGLPSD